MYILQNAFKNIVRNRGRNLLIGGIMFLIIVTCVIALTINNTSNGIIEEYKDRFSSEAVISRNSSAWRGFTEEEREAATITPAQYIEFGNSDLLSSSYYQAELAGSSDDLEAVDENSENVANIQAQSADGSAVTPPVLKLLGNYSLSDLSEFTNGDREIVEGEFYNDLNECIISEELAELNGLSVGDTFTFHDTKDNTTYELLITGIYSDLTDEYSSIIEDPYLNRRNEVLTSFETLTTDGAISDELTLNANYYLSSPELLEEFEAELFEKGLSEDLYTVSTDESTYYRIITPVENLKSVAVTFVIIVVALGSVILVLLSSIAMRERKYEIGVFRTMGMKKWKVSLGLLTEMVTIMAICLVLGLGVGNVSAQSISDILLEQQIEALDTSAYSNTTINTVDGGTQAITEDGGNGPSLTQVGDDGTVISTEDSIEVLSQMDVTFGWDTVGQIMIISILLVGVSSIVSIRAVTKYEPLKILTERN